MNSDMNITLSKTNYMNGLQCRKYLWYLFNAKEDIPEPDESQQAIFDQGHMVGDYAKKLFPNGIEIPFSKTETIKLSLEALKKRVPIFEASLAYNNCYARADILEPVGKNEWNIIEVKSSTGLKDENLFDIGFQCYIYTGARLKINKCYLMHLNNKYVRRGEIDVKKLFKKIDVTSEVKTKYSKIAAKNSVDMMNSISADRYPEPGIGPHCTKPYECPLKGKCWSFLPERNVFFLYRNKKLPFALIKDGIMELRDISQDKFKLNKNQKIQVDCERTGRPHIDPKKIKKFLDSIEYPVYYMDFETYQTAIPMFDGARPYDNIPFQFSVHVVERAGAEPKHHSFLAEGRGDPRPEFMARLKEIIGTNGSVVAFNAVFETGGLKECAMAYPEYAEWVVSIVKRMKDLLKPFRAFAYYHPKQNGSCSLKRVLPVLTDRSYSDMEIGDGGTASREYFRVTFTEGAEDQAKVRNLLEEYCSLDTMGMVEMMESLKALSS